VGAVGFGIQPGLVSGERRADCETDSRCCGGGDRGRGKRGTLYMTMVDEGKIRHDDGRGDGGVC
jgi:hypothetical protein